jgi:hypothetical protein
LQHSRSKGEKAKAKAKEKEKEEERREACDENNQEVEIHESNMDDAGVRRDISERQQVESEKAEAHRRAIGERAQTLAVANFVDSIPRRVKSRRHGHFKSKILNVL